MAVVYARVKFQYQPQADDELPLEVGSVITVLEQYDGELNGFEGVFPENHVEIIDGPPTGAGQLFQARALYAYKAQAEDQLDLEEGDIITVVQELEHGWWAGTINGKAGIFPASFTEKIADSRAGANPFAADTSSTLFGSSAGEDAGELKSELIKLQAQFKEAMEGMKAIIDQQHNDQLKLVAIVADLKDELNQLKARVGK